jgi:isopentenyl-diphosphate delta-isomerase
MALPMLKAAKISTTAVLNEIRHFERALKTAMFLSGCTNIDELKKAPIHIPANLTPEVYEGHEKSPEE